MIRLGERQAPGCCSDGARIATARHSARANGSRARSKGVGEKLPRRTWPTGAGLQGMIRSRPQQAPPKPAQGKANQEFLAQTNKSR